MSLTLDTGGDRWKGQESRGKDGQSGRGGVNPEANNMKKEEKWNEF